MITNSSVTIYHKGFDSTTKLETWNRYNYENVWYFGGLGGTMNKGYDNANGVQIRIPYKENNNLDINNFAIGDIIVKGKVTINITTQADLSNYQIYNITSIKNNDFGTKHIHIGGN